MLANANGDGGYMRRPNTAGNIFCGHCYQYHGPFQTCVPAFRFNLPLEWHRQSDAGRNLSSGILSGLRLDHRGLPIYRVKAGSAPCLPGRA